MNTTIVHKGEEYGHKLYLVLKGSLNLDGRIIECHQMVGDDGLHDTSYFRSPLTTAEDSEIASISREDLERQVGGPLHNVYLLNQAIQVLRKIQMFKSVPARTLELLAHTLRLQ